MQNNNTAIIRKITERTLSSDKKRNIFVVVAIMLTTFMLASVFSVGLSFYKTTQRQQTSLMGTTAHAGISLPTPEQMEILGKLDYVKESGAGNHVASIKVKPEMGDMSLSFFYFDKSSWEKMRAPAYDDIVGSYPQNPNEIMVPKWVLESMGIENPELGMSIILDYFIDTTEKRTEYTQEFVLSGYFTSYMYVRSGNIDTILVSKALSDTYGRAPQSDGSATVIFKDVSRIMDYCDRLEKDLGISESQSIRPIPMYDVDSSERSSWLVSIVLIVSFIMFTGYLLIYNVMYISVSRDIRFYGMLKTVGTTPKQIRKIVIGQILRMSLVGILIGTILAALFSLVLVPMIINSLGDLTVKAKISFSPLIYVGAVCLSLLTAFIGASKPARKAAEISPIEAVKFIGAETKEGNIRGNANAKPYKMAFRNIFRDRKRAFVVLLSLFISVTTFITITAVVNSMNIDNYISDFFDYDFSIKNNTANFISSDTKQKFTKEILEQLQSVSGIEYIETNTQAMFYLTYSEKLNDQISSVMEKEPTEKEMESLKKGLSSVTVGIGSEALEELNKTLEKPFDIAAFERGDYVLIATNIPEKLESIDSIEVRLNFDSTEMFNLNVGGFVPPYFKSDTSSIGPTIICSNTLMEKLLGDPFIRTVNINVKKGYDAQALDEIKAITEGDKEISRTSRIEESEKMRSNKIIMYTIGGGIALILGLIGFMNFVNVMSVGIMVRKRELATLESVGMSKIQMRKMLIFEGLWYAIITIAFVSTLGTLISMTVFGLFKQQATYAVYAYPFIPALISGVTIFLICVATPEMAYRSISKFTLIERLREVE